MLPHSMHHHLEWYFCLYYEFLTRVAEIAAVIDTGLSTYYWTLAAYLGVCWVLNKVLNRRLPACCRG